ncbi:MAG: hypothetical protein D4R64_14260 [Porphyromonadaceae bacterium]|nr:MAG: hypothetical protein D4R64_14260 [Porphyromonadaceae bacterium]
MPPEPAYRYRISDFKEEEIKNNFALISILSAKAKIIIKKTSEDKDGYIIVFSNQECYELICGQKNIQCSSAREFAGWESAVKQLLDNELIIFESQNKGTVYRLTEKGYLTADDIDKDTQLPS